MLRLVAPHTHPTSAPRPSSITSSKRSLRAGDPIAARRDSEAEGFRFVSNRRRHLLRCWWIHGGNPPVHLPRRIRLTLKNAHQLAGGADRLTTPARTDAVVVRPPLVGIVAQHLGLQNVEHRVHDF